MKHFGQNYSTMKVCDVLCFKLKLWGQNIQKPDYLCGQGKGLLGNIIRAHRLLESCRSVLEGITEPLTPILLLRARFVPFERLNEPSAFYCLRLFRYCM